MGKQPVLQVRVCNAGASRTKRAPTGPTRAAGVAAVGRRRTGWQRDASCVLMSPRSRCTSLGMLRVECVVAADTRPLDRSRSKRPHRRVGDRTCGRWPCICSASASARRPCAAEVMSEMIGAPVSTGFIVACQADAARRLAGFVWPGRVRLPTNDNRQLPHAAVRAARQSARPRSGSRHQSVALHS